MLFNNLILFHYAYIIQKIDFLIEIKYLYTQLFNKHIMTKFCKNQQILKHSKEQTWKKNMNNYDNRIAQCYNCNNFVKFPKELRHHYKNPDSNLNYIDTKNTVDLHTGINILGTALFARIIDDDMSVNYIIQCMNCNSMINKNIKNECIKGDIIMLDAHIFSSQNMINVYNESEYTCSKMTKRGKKCNKPRHSNDLCLFHIHG